MESKNKGEAKEARIDIPCNEHERIGMILTM